MTLAQKYRAQFTAQRSDRFVFYLAVAVLLHVAALLGSVRFIRSTPVFTVEPEVTPIEFVYLDPPPEPTPTPTVQSEQRAVVTAEGSGPEPTEAEPNAGKPEPLEGKQIEAPAKVTDGAIASVGSTIPIQNPVKPALDASSLKANEVEPALTPPIPQVSAAIPKATLPSAIPPAAAPLPSALPSVSPTLPDWEAWQASAASDPLLPPPNIDFASPSSGPAPVLPPDPFTLAPTSPTPDPIPEATTPEPTASPELDAPDPVEPDVPPDATSPDSPAQGVEGEGLDGTTTPDQVARGADQVSAEQDDILGRYINTLNQSIDQHWQQVPVDALRQPIVWFVIDRQGELVDVGLTQASGAEAADQAALAAIQMAAPFEPLPDAYEPDTLRVNFTFTYNVAPLEPPTPDTVRSPTPDTVESDREP